MKYTLQFILDNRYDKNRNRARILSERYIPLNFIYKILSPYPTYLFLNLGIHPDWVTLASFIFILFGSVLIISGYVLAGVILYLIFLLLDSVDGDMARCIGPTQYGGILDSFGADLFYACSPVSFGYFLFSKDISLGFILPHQILLISAFTSVSFLLYRLINTKLQKFANNQPTEKSYNQIIDKQKEKNALINFSAKVVKLFRHILFKNNFFAEPGMVFWFFILTVFSAYKILTLYLILIFIYNIFYISVTFISTLIYFRRMNV